MSARAGTAESAGQGPAGTSASGAGEGPAGASASGSDPVDGVKLAELALLIAEQLADDPGFGATRLNKALFFSDHLHYKRLGSPISGAPYERLPRAPAPRGILDLWRRLVDEGAARVEIRGYLGHQQRRLIPLRPALRECFAAGELQLLSQVCNSLRGHSHANALGWQLAEEGEEIVYPSAFLSTITPIRADLARGLDLARKRGLVGAGAGSGRPGSGAGGAGVDGRPGSGRQLRSIGWECSVAGLRQDYPRADEVLEGLVWACARWPEGIHRIPGTRLHLVKAQWPVPSLAAWFTLESENRCTIWAVEEIEPYLDQEDGTD